MKGRFLADDWYRVASLRPRLRSHVEMHRQIFRGDTWYVVQDLHSGKYHRVTPAGNLFLSLMNGRRTVQQLWELACERFPDDPPTQPEVIHLLSQLHGADLVAGDSLPDLPELGRRHFREARKAMIARLRNPLAMRFGLFDPDAFLDRTVWLVRPLFTTFGFLAWLGLVLTGIVLAALNWGPLTSGLTDRVLSADNIMLIVLAFPLVKALHEMGHAYATKVWGGEVHEIGVMILVLIPVPYVDASASAAFAEKWRRAVVGGAGIMVELALAAVAMIFWVNAEPGLARAFAFNVMLIGGVSTLLFNGNPLLRFDGYFVLADLVEIPNLGQRANKYFWYLVQRYPMGLQSAENPVTARGERAWLFGYAVSAFVYRLFIAIAISLFIASQLFVIGVALAIWSLANSFVFPVFKGLRWLVTAQALRGKRRRAVLVSGSVAAALGYLLLAQPIPHVTLAPAVVVLEEDDILRAGTDGFVTELALTQGDVTTGDLVLRLDQPELDADLELVRLQRDELRMRFDAIRGRDPLMSQTLTEQLTFLEERLARMEARRDNLDLDAPQDGFAVVLGGQDIIGRFVNKGAEMGYVLTDGVLLLRAAVPESKAELVRASGSAVQVSLMRSPAQAVDGRVVSAAPEGQLRLPSKAFATEGGGPFAVNPTDGSGLTSIEQVFIFDIEVPAGPLPQIAGDRALVRFDHGYAPLGERVWRTVRQLFLRQFNV